jgi:hypothetical protein
VTSWVAAILLWLLLALFCLRVAGQVVVVWLHPRWLPSMDQWYSGLLPYPLLLPAQILLITLMTAIALQVSASATPFGKPHPTVGLVLIPFSFVYAGSMAVRYALRMRRHPDQRWLDGTIPIIFHVVLAAFLFLFAWIQLG